VGKVEHVNTNTVRDWRHVLESQPCHSAFVYRRTSHVASVFGHDGTTHASRSATLAGSFEPVPSAERSTVQAVERLTECPSPALSPQVPLSLPLGLSQLARLMVSCDCVPLHRELLSGVIKGELSCVEAAELVVVTSPLAHLSRTLVSPPQFLMPLGLMPNPTLCFWLGKPYPSLHILSRLHQTQHHNQMPAHCRSP
jgi:hypothetical protein